MQKWFTLSEQIIAHARYCIHAGHRKDRCVYSSFVNDFITSVLTDNREYAAYNLAENNRKELLKNKTPIDVTDMGAGSRADNSDKRSVAAIAKHASVKPKFGRLLFRITRYYKPDRVIELGTSLGISTHYLALGNPDARVITMEADPNLATMAVTCFKKHNLMNVELINDTFDNTLPTLMFEPPVRTLVFIDGNHDKSATLKYAGFFFSKIPDGSIVIIDDINWSKGMRQAWKEIREIKKNTVTLDLFCMGIVFQQTRFFKENYTIRF